MSYYGFKCPACGYYSTEWGTAVCPKCKYSPFDELKELPCADKM